MESQNSLLLYKPWRTVRHWVLTSVPCCTKALYLAFTPQKEHIAPLWSLVPEVKTKITRNGVLVFTLPDGGKICDSGRQITFSDTAKEKATEYMAAKWLVKKQEWGINRGSLMLPHGQYLEDTGKNMFVRPAMLQIAKEQQKKIER